MMANSQAISPAANRWQKGLIGAMQNYGLRIIVLGHVPAPLWPKGTLRMKIGQSRLAPGLQGAQLPYWNVPFWRTRHLSNLYLKAFCTFCKREGHPAVVMTYNDYPWHATVGLYAQSQLGIPWICVVADAPGAGQAFKAHEAVIKEAAGRIFLSWGRYRDASCEPKLHLDGGITKIHFDPNVPLLADQLETPVVLFTGSMTRWAGSQLLVESFMAMKTGKAELWLCGPGSNRDVKQAALKDSRIKILGLLTESELQRTCRRATLFVNPRPSSLSGNRSNFPSKVLEYFSYGKPVISTWTDGLSPDYRQVIVLLDEDNAAGLRKKIEEVLAWENGKLQENRQRTFDFLNRNKQWSGQAERLICWLDGQGFTKT